MGSGPVSIVVFFEGDALSLHVRAGHQAVGFKSQGAAQAWHAPGVHARLGHRLTVRRRPRCAGVQGGAGAGRVTPRRRGQHRLRAGLAAPPGLRHPGGAHLIRGLSAARAALVRIEGRPLGVEANDPAHLAGAIDSRATIKPARIMKLCAAHDLALHLRCEQPGNRVRQQHEKTALVRHCAAPTSPLPMSACRPSR